jgi:hypothetical protein
MVGVDQGPELERSELARHNERDRPVSKATGVHTGS